MGVINASTAVDSFFLLSGLLVTYMVLKELKKSKGRLRPDPASFFGMYYLLRYIRLTPAFAVGIGLVATLVRHFGSGPLWGNMIENADLCQVDWWKYMIYAFNYVRPSLIYEGQMSCFPQVRKNDSYFLENFIPSVLLI
jgi:peptidoglycan/LPS O-acetylase OafA/YrhL